jgi:serine/threonine protein kinase
MNAHVEQLVGRTLGGRYRLERTLGVGGMGAVFEATQIGLGRTVAVKVLLDVDPRGIARLKQEALTAGSLSCPHVVSIFDFMAPDGEPPFIVMEILPGHSLAKLLQQQRTLAVPRAARIASQMLIGLEAAHRAGVIHRDVKPSNTWLVFGPGIDEHVKMLDFGIAKMLGGDGPGLHTTTGSVVGTPAYLAPEQLRGMPLDARVDIHAMGIVLFEMLTGARPWRSDTGSIYAEILERQPPPIHTLAPNIPPALSQIVERALAKDPAARFQRAADMRAALEAFAANSANMPATVMGGLSSSTNTFGGVAPTIGGVAPTIGNVPPTMGMTPPPYSAPYGFQPASSMYPSAPTLPPTASGGYPIPMHMQTAPIAAQPRARAGFAFPFLLGGGIVVLAGGAIAVAFLLGRDHGKAAGAADAAPAGAAAPAAVNAPSTANDAGARTASPAATTKGGKPTTAAPAATAPAAAAGAVAATGATSARCECETPRGGLVCTVTKTPNCSCTTPTFASLCPVKPDASGSCSVRPGGLLPYSGAGRKNGETCSGFAFLNDGSTPLITGVTDCQFCYGRDKIAGVPGAVCRGQIGTGETNIEGHLVCDR